MNRFGSTAGLIVFILMLFAAMGWGADPVPVAVPVVAAPAASFLLWAKQNLTIIFGILLAFSELMGSSPWFKGNGIFDSIIKCLKFLLQKEQGA